jgi:hypothetical protein
MTKQGVRNLGNLGPKKKRPDAPVGGAPARDGTATPAAQPLPQAPVVATETTPE